MEDAVAPVDTTDRMPLFVIFVALPPKSRNCATPSVTEIVPAFVNVVAGLLATSLTRNVALPGAELDTVIVPRLLTCPCTSIAGLLPAPLTSRREAAGNVAPDKTRRGLLLDEAFNCRVRESAKTPLSVTTPAAIVATSPDAGTPDGPQSAAFSNTSDDPFQTLTVMMPSTPKFQLVGAVSIPQTQNQQARRMWRFKGKVDFNQRRHLVSHRKRF